MMRQKWKKRSLNVGIVIVIVAAAVYFYPSKRFDREAMAGVPYYPDLDQSSILESDDISSKLEPSYNKYFEQLISEGVADTEGVEIRIPAGKYAAISSLKLGPLTGAMLIDKNYPK